MSTFEYLTSKTANKVLPELRLKLKGRVLGKVGNLLVSEVSSESKSELYEQVRWRKKKHKIKINSSRAKDDERKEFQKRVRW